jgi:hypothetical protein
MISRKEDAVDVLDGQPKNYPFGTLADPGTLFGKIDYIIIASAGVDASASLAEENARRQSRHPHPASTAKVSNATAGSSDRRTSIFLDEWRR